MLSGAWLRKNAVWLTMGLIALYLLVFYSEVLFHPGARYFSAEGDALKNYYTPAYQVAYGSGLWFEGMNYPYGELLTFTDAQPLLCSALQVLPEGLREALGGTTGIMNLLMLLSLFPTGWYAFKLLRRFGAAEVYAAVAAAGIALLSPQVLRWSGHFALGYLFFVPMIWYWALRFLDTRKWRYAIQISTALFVSAWIHPYYLMIGAVMLVLIYGVWLLRERDWRTALTQGAVQVILPMLAFRLILGAMDPVPDRPESPPGLMEQNAFWQTVFLPHPVAGLSKIASALPAPRHDSWEGMAYVGLGASLLFFVLLVLAAWKGFQALRGGKGRFARLLRALDPDPERPLLAVSVVAALLALLFSFGFPFSLKPDLLIDLFPPIKQFRSVGRFAWIFYYIWTVYAVIRIGEWSAKWDGMKRSLMRGAFVCLLLAEAFLYHEARNPTIKLPELSGETDTDIERIAEAVDTARYGAMIALPWFHIGSENIGSDNTQAARPAMLLSWKTGIPLVNVMMSRTSFSQSWAQEEFMLPPYNRIPPFMDSLFAKGKQVLVLEAGPDARFGAHLRGGKVLAESGGLRLRELRYEDLKQDYAQRIDSPAWRRNWRSLIREPLPGAYEAFMDRADPVAQIQSFHDKEGGADGFMDEHGWEVRIRDNNYLYDGTLPGNAGDTIVLSLRAKIYGDLLPKVRWGYEQRTPDGTDLDWDYFSLADFIVGVDGEWALCEREFILHDPANRIRVNVTNWSRKPESLVIDDFLIRRKSTQVLFFKDNFLTFYNNRFFDYSEMFIAPTEMEGEESPDAVVSPD